MPSLRELQTAFSREVFDGERNDARGFVIGGEFAPEARLAIYRNNLYISLREALAALYPVVEQLVGGDFFAAAARAFIPLHPSRSGNLHAFGAAFPAFLAGWEPAAGLPYLPDTARVEWAWHHAFHAAEAVPFDAGRLAGVAPERCGELRFALHPGVTIVTSDWPVGRLWAAHQEGGPALESLRLDAGGETVLVQRRGLAVEVSRLEAGEAAWLARLAAGGTLETATGAALEAEPGFDLNACLQRHLQRTTLVDAVLPGSGDLTTPH
jgi:hypothetical protein